MSENARPPISENPSDWTLPAIAEALGFPSTCAMAVALGSIDKSGYHQYAIQGSRKRRVISEPRRWLKSIQRRAHEVLLSALPVAEVGFSRRGVGVVEHARQHVAHDYVTVLDVANCFPSTTVAMVRNAFRRAGARRDVADTLTRLTTLHGFLPQGAPTSPAVLNLVFLGIDLQLKELASRYDATYTRYMDDLAFSGSHPLAGLAHQASTVVRRNGYFCNPSKRREWGPDDAHTITNIVVTTTLNPTPEFLRSLARHLEKFGTRDCGLTEVQLRGKVAWVKRLNPRLGRSLERKLLSRAARLVET